MLDSRITWEIVATNAPIDVCCHAVILTDFSNLTEVLTDPSCKISEVMQNHISLNAHEGSSMYCHLEVAALDQQVQFASGFCFCMA
jgi:hypothetical protein